MGSAAVLMLVRTVMDLYSIIENEKETQWWWSSLIEWLPDVPPCLGYMYLFWDPAAEASDEIRSENGAFDTAES